MLVSTRAAQGKHPPRRPVFLHTDTIVPQGILRSTEAENALELLYSEWLLLYSVSESGTWETPGGTVHLRQIVVPWPSKRTDHHGCL